MKQKVFLYVLVCFILCAVSAAVAQDDVDPAPAAVEGAPAPPAAADALRITNGLLALYVASEVTGGIILPDKSGTDDPLDLIIQAGEMPTRVYVTDDALVFSPKDAQEKPPGCFSAHPADRIVRAVQTTGEISVEAWVTPSLAEQHGPARIITISRDTAERNVTLGHSGTSFAVRLRTAATTPNGTPELVSPPETIEADTLYHVVFTFDGIWSTLYIDGEMVAQSNDSAGAFVNWDSAMFLGLGNEIGGERLWFGALHLAAIYDRALNEEEVAQNFAAGF